MATTTLAAILAAWAAVLEAAPFTLPASQGPFTHDNQPNGTVESYYLTDGGNVQRKSVTNAVEVRIDRVQVWVAKPLNFAAAAQLQAMETLGDDIYRNLIVTARAAGYNVEADVRRITRPANSELLIASFDFMVDYDWSSAVS